MSTTWRFSECCVSVKKFWAYHVEPYIGCENLILFILKKKKSFFYRPLQNKGKQYSHLSVLSKMTTDMKDKQKDSFRHKSVDVTRQHRPSTWQHEAQEDGRIFTRWLDCFSFFFSFLETKYKTIVSTQGQRHAVEQKEKM